MQTRSIDDLLGSGRSSSGCHIIGADATEMITTFVLGKSMECTEEDIANACLPHPTLSEMIGEATLDSDGRALNA